MVGFAALNPPYAADVAKRRPRLCSNGRRAIAAQCKVRAHFPERGVVAGQPCTGIKKRRDARREGAGDRRIEFQDPCYR